MNGERRDLRCVRPAEKRFHKDIGVLFHNLQHIHYVVARTLRTTRRICGNKLRKDTAPVELSVMPLRRPAPATTLVGAQMKRQLRILSRNLGRTHLREFCDGRQVIYVDGLAITA